MLSCEVVDLGIVIVLSEISLFFILPAPRLAVWAVPVDEDDQ
jgi:hypothetical protein